MRSQSTCCATRRTAPRRVPPRSVAYRAPRGAERVTVEAAGAGARRPDAARASWVWRRRRPGPRGSARHMAGVDPGTEVPPPGLVTFRQRRRQPFIYSGADIAALMAHARRSIPTPLRAVSGSALLVLLPEPGNPTGDPSTLAHPNLLVY